ncbi:conserved exported hypothetical protein [Gammaproteobacteria bacterium]
MHVSKKLVHVFLLATMAAAPVLAGEYHLGEGYTTGNLNIAGYINLVAEAPHGEKPQLVGDDISLFISGHFNQYFNPFFETEFSGATLWRRQEGLFPDNHPDLILERLYNDFNLTEKFVLRFGKMLAPVGEWNNIHAAPLVSTITRPLTTYRSFSEYVSGLKLIYTPSDEHLPEMRFYWQPDNELAPRPQSLVTREYRRITGVHLNWISGLIDKVGFSFQHATISNNIETQTLLGLNAHKTLGQFQIETEATYTHVNGDRLARVRDDEWGTYLLGSYSINDKWSISARYEYFSDRNILQSSRNALLGLSWHADPAIVWKLEYVKQAGAMLDITTGVFASFSILF